MRPFARSATQKPGREDATRATSGKAESNSEESILLNCGYFGDFRYRIAKTTEPRRKATRETGTNPNRLGMIDKVRVVQGKSAEKSIRVG